MDPDEYEEYLKQVEILYRESVTLGETALLDRLYDEDGYSAPGCYRTLPAPVEE
jgi:hypothetical protein